VSANELRPRQAVV